MYASKAEGNRGFPQVLWTSLIGLALCAGTAIGADKCSFSFTTVDYPGAVSTTVEGINAHGDLAGVYTDPLGHTHAFVVRHGIPASFDYPGAEYTDGRAINAAGDLLGNYRMPGEDPVLGSHGFLLKHNASSPVPIAPFPGHINMIAQRLLPDGSILGCYHDHDFMASMHGFVLSRGRYSEVSIGASMHNGATPDLRRIVGLVYDMIAGRWRAYMIQNGTYTPFDFPGGSFTQGWDMNASGAVVGETIYTDDAGDHHDGFLLEDGDFTAVRAPGATATMARGINNRGDIVGRFVDVMGAHGFVARRGRRDAE